MSENEKRGKLNYWKMEIYTFCDRLFVYPTGNHFVDVEKNLLFH
jgi:hypothetical protein